ncbi:tetratricopeptide repeat protein [Dokdonella sp.]|uniref:tetratricopeptide repeat protein n=1 Tax=Dokdonella sp. TaxID=2291710 RepID=UPI003C6170B2
MRRAVRLFCVFLFWVFVVGCSPSTPQGIVEVAPPKDLAVLDVTVRDQFEAIWGTLREARESGEGRGIAWGRLGQWFDAYRYDDSAELCYANARLHDPEEARWPYYQGLIAVQIGDIDLANRRFSEAAQRAPDAPGPQVQLGDLALAQSQLEVAESRYRLALSLDADNPEALFGIAQIALARNDPKSARDTLEHLLVLQPNASQVHYSLALAWGQLGDRKRAARHMSKVPEENGDQVRLALNDPWINELLAIDVGAVALTRRAVQAVNRGQRVEAALLFGQAVTADPLGPDKRINYAKALIAVDQANSAIEQLERALALSKDQPESASRAHLALASLYARQRRASLAEPHLFAALANDPGSVDGHIQLGRLRQAQGNHEAALAEYATVRNMAGANAEVCFWHAALLVILKRHDDAQKAIEKDLERLGDDAHLRWLLSRVLAATQDVGPETLARASALLGDEKNPDVFFAETAAMVAAAQSRFADAEAWQRVAIDALDGERTRLAAHIARRRLVLYQQRQSCRNPWEVTERVIFRKIAAPTNPVQETP